MSKVVIVSHSHDANAGVYRLVFANQEEHEVDALVDNPDFDPNQPLDEEDNWITRVETQTEKVLVNHQDIVWADDDERWKGKSDDDIAAEQRKEVSERLTQLVAERERAEAEAAAAHTDFGGAGEEL
jgi:hypothetical protein